MLKVRSRNKILSFITIHFLAGLVVAFLGSLLIYFKRKEVFHHSFILVSIFSVQLIFLFLRKYLNKTSEIFLVGSLILLMLACILGPQFFYQIRPFTFYISGFAVAIILIIAISSSLLAPDPSLKFPWWNVLIFCAGYLIGYYISPEFLQYIIIGLSIVFAINFTVSVALKPIFGTAISVSIFLCLLGFWWFSLPIIYFDEQSDYEDKVIFSRETQYHEVVITQWHHDNWVFIDGLKNLSSIDEYLYYEPMAHSVSKVKERMEDVLVIGGENGCLIREVLKIGGVKRITVVSYDTLLRDLGRGNQYFLAMNKGAYNSDKVSLIQDDVLRYISNPIKKYDAIFLDLPDPKSVETNQYYTIEFYNLIRGLLNETGVMITQAGSPYFATQAFYAIGKTIRAAGFHVLPIHNQILTLGEWGWYICSMSQGSPELKEKLVRHKEFDFETKWFNDEAAYLISSFGKTYIDTLNVEINSLENPMVYQYYLKGNWNFN